jgi:hypothetical protein
MRLGTWALLLFVLAPRGAWAYAGGGGDGMGLQAATSFGPRAAYYGLAGADGGVWGAGAQMRVHMNPGTSLELSGDFVHYASHGTGVTSTPVQATLVGYFYPESSITPYLLLGVGWYPTHAAGPYSAPRLFGPHAGGGIELLLGGNWSIDGSYRYLWTEIYSLTHPGRLYGEDFQERGHLFTAAINYRL